MNFKIRHCIEIDRGSVLGHCSKRFSRRDHFVNIARVISTRWIPLRDSRNAKVAVPAKRTKTNLETDINSVGRYETHSYDLYRIDTREALRLRTQTVCVLQFIDSKRFVLTIKSAVVFRPAKKVRGCTDRRRQDLEILRRFRCFSTLFIGPRRSVRPSGRRPSQSDGTYFTFVKANNERFYIIFPPPYIFLTTRCRVITTLRFDCCGLHAQP